ncbi:MAG: hypothetical protein R3F43_02260 [bacterium]
MHCEQSCVMRDAESGRGLDQLPHYCPEHRALAEAHSRGAPARAPWCASRRAHAAGGLDGGHRRLPARAAQHSRRLQGADGHGGRAHGARRAHGGGEAFVAASRSAPRAAQPYYARAVLYAAGVAPRRAPAFLEAAVGRDEDPRRAHRAAGILYQELLEDPAQAARHFQAHVSAGGRDPDVIARLVYLIQPTT